MDLTHKTILRLTSFADLYLFNLVRNAGYERHVSTVLGTILVCRLRVHRLLQCSSAELSLPIKYFLCLTSMLFFRNNLLCNINTVKQND